MAKTSKKTVPRKARPTRRSPAESLGPRLARLRQEHGLTQRELAEQLGVRQPFVSHFEKGARGLTPDLLVRLAGILHTTTDDLLGLTKPRITNEPVPRRFLQRMRVIDQLSDKEQRTLLQTLDAFLERAQLRSQAR